MQKCGAVWDAMLFVSWLPSGPFHTQAKRTNIGIVLITDPMLFFLHVSTLHWVQLDCAWADLVI